jgi:hypothetical protein
VFILFRTGKIKSGESGKKIRTVGNPTRTVYEDVRQNSSWPMHVCSCLYIRTVQQYRKDPAISFSFMTLNLVSLWVIPQDDIKMYRKEIECRGVDWIQLAKDTVQRQAPVNTEIGLWVT